MPPKEGAWYGKGLRNHNAVSHYHLKKGDVLAFGTLQDSEGDIDLVFFPKVWNECSLLKLDETVLLKGNIDNSKPQKSYFVVSGIAEDVA